MFLCMLTHKLQKKIVTENKNNYNKTIQVWYNDRK